MSAPAPPPSEPSSRGQGERPVEVADDDAGRPAASGAASGETATATPAVAERTAGRPSPGDRDGDGTVDRAEDADLDDPDHVPDDVAPNARPATRRRVWSIQRRRRKHKGRSKLYRGIYIVVASLIFLVGLVSGPLPGPGPVILIPLGLAMLALEFVWAERALAFALDKAEGAKEGASKASPKQRAFVVAAVVLFFAAAIAFVFVLDIPIPLLNPSP